MKSTTLYVSNLPYSATSEDLAKLFEKFEGTEARVISNKGYGFVDLPAEQADAAVEAMDNIDFSGRKLRVSIARPRNPR